VRVLGIDVPADLHHAWRGWLAPASQPFFVADPDASHDRTALTPELGHTYRTWRLDAGLGVRWLDETAFLDLPRTERARLVRAQVSHGRGAVPSVRRWSTHVDVAPLQDMADGHRFVWWPSIVDRHPHEVLARVVAAAPDGAAPDASPSRHREVGRRTWRATTAVVPRAEEVAGTFPTSSGPNCFGTVLGAAGVEGAEHECVLQDPFLEWLASAARPAPRREPAGHRDRAGTVLVWRDAAGAPVHAAVTIGDGWALEKASGEWWTPRAIRPVAEVVRAARLPGQHLERHHLG
jgi:hypothetical protein